MFKRITRVFCTRQLAPKYVVMSAALAIVILFTLAMGLMSIWNLAFVGLLGIQLILVYVVAQSRTVISRRLFAVARQLERHIDQIGGKILSSERVQPVNSKPAAVGQTKPIVAISSPSSKPASKLKNFSASTSIILKSGIFDQEWYEAQAGVTFETERDACHDYLVTGRMRGLSPHPLFVVSMVDPNWSKSTKEPLVEYLNNPGVNRKASTHPLFDPKFLSDKSKKRIDEDWGALYTFLKSKNNDSLLPSKFATDEHGLSIRYGEFRERMMVTAKQWTDRLDAFRPLQGSNGRPETSEELHDFLDRFDQTNEPKPRISIILPTWNRAAKLRDAIDSVQQQTYVNWELLIADDGSTDDTRLSVLEETKRDSRIIYIPLEHRGVSAARNSALEAAKGDLVAFLDSDKVWDPEFLRVMVAWISGTGCRAAAAVCEVSIGGRTTFFGEQATESSLGYGNSIDQTALVASLDLVQSFGGFDETLKRAVDYDLILSISERTEIAQVPYIGVRYSEDNSDPNRISEAESVSWNFFVSDRRKWQRFNASPLPVLIDGLTSIIVDAVASYKQAQEVLENIYKSSGGANIEIIIIAADNTWLNWYLLAASTFSRYPVTLVHAHHGGVHPATINDALRQSRGEFLMVMHGGQRFFSGDLANLLGEFESPNVAVVHPAVLGKRRLIDDLGIVYSESVSEPIPLATGLSLDGLGLQDSFDVPGAGLPLLVRTRRALDISGFNTKLKNLWCDVDFSQRIPNSEFGRVVVSPNSVIQQMHRSAFDRQIGAAADIRMFRSEWERGPSGSMDAAASLGLEVSGFKGFSALSFPDDPTRWGRLDLQKPQVDIRQLSPRLRWAIKCAAPADERSAVWGDFHFANSLANSLRKLGQFVSVDYFDNSDRPTSDLDDVVLNLRGLRDIPLPVSTLNLLWVISHPDKVSAVEIGKYDKVYAASSLWAARQSEQWGRDIAVLLQCTDSNLFYPDFDPEIAREHDLLFVGNSREVYRPAPWTAARAGLPVRIYGGGWKGLVPDENIAGTFVENDILRRYYSSARFTLNDHWPEMREDGFIANRVFDVVASGGRIITDAVSGLEEIFGPEVLVYKNPHDLLSILESSVSASRDIDRSILTNASERVRAEHSFDARAVRLLDDAVEMVRIKRS